MGLFQRSIPNGGCGEASPCDGAGWLGHMGRANTNLTLFQGDPGGPPGPKGEKVSGG